MTRAPKALCIALLSAAAACGSAQPLPRAEIVPQRTGSSAAPDAAPEAAPHRAADWTRAASDTRPTPPDAEYPDYPVVQRDLPQPIARPNVYVVDSPRYPRGEWNGEVWIQADPWGVPYAPYYKRPRGGRFPVNTAVGAGIGAIVGHQRGRRHRGALIGGSIGLLFDLQRLWH